MSEVKRVFNYKKIIMLAYLCALICFYLCILMFLRVANGQSEREINRYNKYIESYHDEIDSVIKNADYLQKFSIFNKGKTFTYSNILRTANDFRRIQNVEVSYDNSRAVESFVNYYYSYYIAFFFVLIIVYDLFKYRENGVWQIYILYQERKRLYKCSKYCSCHNGGCIISCCDGTFNICVFSGVIWRNRMNSEILYRIYTALENLHIR